MGRLRRLDAEVHRRKLAPSRTQAALLIEAGRVKVDGQVQNKPARQIDPAQAIVIIPGESEDYASRGGHKLAGALDILGEKAPQIQGKRCLDAGASTGGFTDVLLRRGAEKVLAVDVGYGQLRWELQQDPRVEVHDRCNIRYLTLEQIGTPADLIVSDLSFISLTLVLEPLKNCGHAQSEFLLMVKPQFEIGKEDLGAGGVVRDPRDHYQTVMKVILKARNLGLGLKAVAASPLPGPSGNIEYFIHLGADPAREYLTEAQAEAALNLAIEKRPKL